MNTAWVWCIAVGTAAGILLRPSRWPEAVWACAGAFLLVAFRLLPLSRALSAVGKGTDVYLFLTGMMLLSEMARREGVFDWMASLAVRAAKRSRARLFALVYGVGTVVTVVLSNDATAVVLTPAVYAAVKRARSPALPYLFICAFIANAASFVLPISNPANLVVYGKALPPLLPWLRVFFLPSVISIAVTYAALRWVMRTDVRGEIPDGEDGVELTATGKRACGGILFTAAVLIIASAAGRDLGLPTALAAVLSVLVVERAGARPCFEIARHISSTVLPMVAGLFVIVEALNQAGALKDVAGVLQRCGALPRVPGGLLASFGMAAVSNLMNNLPSGLLAGGALQSAHFPGWVRDSVMIGVDLGPNLSVTGSLATVLWLIALRREGEHVSAGQFLKAGAIVMPPALLLATIAAALLSS